MPECKGRYSLRRVVDVEPEHVVRQMTRVLPIMRDRLRPHFPGRKGFTVASVVTRIALSHALIPDDAPEMFYAELRHAPRLATRDRKRAPRQPRRAVRRISREKVR